MSAPQEDETGVRAWRPDVWGPLGLLAVHGLFAFFFNPFAERPTNEELMGLLIGVLLSQPMFCALWAAWAPTPMIQRGPTGVASCVLLFLMASLRDWDSMLAVLFAILGVVYWGLFALLRWRLQWRLQIGLGNVGQGDLTAMNQFGIRYLFIWTTLVAALCALARAVTVTSGVGIGSVGEMVLVAVVFGTLVVPAPAAARIILSDGVTWRRGGGLAALFFVCVIASGVVADQVKPGPDLGEAVYMFIWFSLGSVLGAAASALVLRWSGYRIVSGAPGGGNTDDR